ncbi:hypothetical protein [Flavobacterium sp.]|uniref:hypothetical protein n=1 Tax=Flavobacterium sp. TaxID=239 RepID=UPI003F6A11FB
MKQLSLIFTFILLLINTNNINAQSSKKTTRAKKISSSVNLDGILDENEWKDAPIANDLLCFIQTMAKQKTLTKKQK